jgi:hypothetical protein
MSLYNLKTLDDGSFTITKFTNDLEPESSYTVTMDTCDCPAGQRPTCRHRQMLPSFLDVDAADQPMFYNFDTKEFLVQDFGTEDSLDSQSETGDQTTLAQDSVDAFAYALEARSALSTPSPDQEQYLQTIADQASKPIDMTQVVGGPNVHPAVVGPLKRRI